MAYSRLISSNIASLGYVTVLTQAIVKYDTYGLLTLFCLGVVLVPKKCLLIRYIYRGSKSLEYVRTTYKGLLGAYAVHYGYHNLTHTVHRLAHKASLCMREYGQRLAGYRGNPRILPIERAQETHYL
jgi:hypothetical protein